MTRSPQSFDRLIDLARDQADDAATRLNGWATERRNAQQQLDMLKDYRQDYAKRLNGAGHHGMTASNYHNFTRFLATLDEAIVQQTKVMAHLDHHLELSQEDWRATRRRLNSYEALQDRRQRQHRDMENRREQRATDELSAMMHRRRPTRPGIP